MNVAKIQLALVLREDSELASVFHRLQLEILQLLHLLLVPLVCLLGVDLAVGRRPLLKPVNTVVPHYLLFLFFLF